MQSGYYSATGAIVTQFNRLDVISNNLANLNTDGFKRDDLVIGEFERLWQSYHDELPIDPQTKESSSYINRALNKVPIIVDKYTDGNVGAIAKTSNPLDFAISKPNLYFVISTPDGIRYSRNGAFAIDENGVLVNKDGFPVLSALSKDAKIRIPSGANVEATANGELSARMLNNEAIGTPINLGRLAVVEFLDPRYLKKQGQNLYALDEKVEKLQNYKPNIDIEAVVRQGFLEKSNVNAVKEMAALIETNRLVDMYSKVMKTQMDDLNSEAINKLANIRA